MAWQWAWRGWGGCAQGSITVSLVNTENNHDQWSWWKTIIRRARRYQQTGQALSIGWIHSCLCYGSWGEIIVHDDHHPCCRHDHHHDHHHHHEGWPQPGYAPRQHCRLRKGRVHHVTEQRHQRSLIIIIMMILTIMIIEVSPGGPRAVFVRSERIQTSNVSTIILPGPSSPLILRWHFVIIVKVIIIFIIIMIN